MLCLYSAIKIYLVYLKDALQHLNVQKSCFEVYAVIIKVYT